MKSSTVEKPAGKNKNFSPQAKMFDENAQLTLHMLNIIQEIKAKLVKSQFLKFKLTITTLKEKKTCKTHNKFEYFTSAILELFCGALDIIPIICTHHVICRIICPSITEYFIFYANHFAV